MLPFGPGLANVLGLWFLLLCKNTGGGGDIPCGRKYESTNSGLTKSVPLLKNERTNYVWFPIVAHEKQRVLAVITPPPCISYANVRNYYGPYAHCSLDKGVACAQHIQLPTHTCARAWYECTLTSAHIPSVCKRKEALGT